MGRCWEPIGACERKARFVHGDPSSNRLRWRDYGHSHTTVGSDFKVGEVCQQRDLASERQYLGTRACGFGRRKETGHCTVEIRMGLVEYDRLPSEVHTHQLSRDYVPHRVSDA